MSGRRIGSRIWRLGTGCFTSSSRGGKRDRLGLDGADALLVNMAGAAREADRPGSRLMAEVATRSMVFFAGRPLSSVLGLARVDRGDHADCPPGWCFPRFLVSIHEA